LVGIRIVRTNHGSPPSDGVVNLGTFSSYVGRFAPSPTGPLHAGSLVAALASWLDARAWNGGAGGRWLIRIEDLDTQRCAPGAATEILRQLQNCGLVPDEPPVFQSQRMHLYQQALVQLMSCARVYPCACSRKDLESELARLGQPRPRHGELVYPGTCRHGLQGKPALAWRFLVAPACEESLAARTVYWIDRRLGMQMQDVSSEVGDFVVLRADGPFAYQLAVVVDDAAQHVSHVVRGEDLCDNTARQILLQRALKLPLPQYLHAPLVLAASGEKLSKQNGATALDTRMPLHVLNAAAGVLGLPPQSGSIGDALATWVAAWCGIYNPQL
jgi:glutamyl-Q tRNA(Asp) synthetase